MRTRQQIIIQTPGLINTPQCRRRDMKTNHLVQHLGIQPLVLNVGIPSTTRLFHTEGDVVPETDVFAVVEAAA